MDRSENGATDLRKPSVNSVVRAFLEGLTGPSKGQIIWLSDDVVSASVGDDRLLLISKDGSTSSNSDQVAFLSWDGGSYTIEAVDNRHVWVNGHRISSVHLMHGDMIEFEDHGPMSRFRLCQDSFPTKWPVNEIVGDALAYARSSRRPLSGRMSMALRESFRRMALQTTYFFRLSVVAVLCAFTAFGIVLYRNDQKIQATLAQDARRIEAVTLLLAQTRDEALSEEDLTYLQQQLETRMTQNTERLGALEKRSDAASRVIAASAPSIAFVQGAFGLRHVDSGELLRRVLGPGGQMLETPFGQPRIELNGDGPPAEFQFTGTGFLLGNGQHLVTNRHVALPWTAGDRVRAFEASGLKPEMLKMSVYLPDMQGAISAELLGFSEVADVAVLTVAPLRIDGRGLSLSPTPTRAGEEVYLLGYPTGLKALLAQAGSEFVNSIKKNSETDFWSVAARLSDRNLINPLASGGIVAQVSSSAVVYDAETTVGGSGGPALNRFGRVVAVNAAILPEFGGSNIGVPVSRVEDLLSEISSE
ncbi:MAG: trypsin-like peptidase domain-containing protein [Paracoccaceae bacterium]